MKRVRIVAAVESDVPDGWAVLNRQDKRGHFLLINGDRYQPTVAWRRLDGESADGGESWVDATKEISEIWPKSAEVMESESVEEIGDRAYAMAFEDDVAGLYE